MRTKIMSKENNINIEGTSVRFRRDTVRRVFFKIFNTSGVLPFFLLIAIIVFTLFTNKFLTLQNLTNVARQSVYLTLVSLGQMIVLITGGFDLSVGTSIAITSVMSSTAMVYAASIFPNVIWLIILVGILASILSALIIGFLNGVGVSRFQVSPFIMTLGVQSIGAGFALFITGGVPVTGLIPEFGNVFGFGKLFGVPVPVLFALVAIIIFWFVMNRTKLGTYIYAVGGNIKAANLSGINTKKILLLSYVLCALLASMAGFLLTARVESGETNLGATVALESIAACVIAGVSLRGGIGKIENVVLGAFFIIMVQNGMNLLQVGSYMQMILLGSLLILAIIFDRYRFKFS
ncbi:monosaccharide ABC transporter membrane protein, CUT2 family [Tenacibaculum sp. MAR_2009_124]|uniref:ABC transporter permease n=1 Tax=Tenacibaculum sp. MAR_2009_124 TaxID=1250059 RepID=UPI00089D3F1F|nr:ABC transporter permease [Tenacibaculum sp. MAR_2009_124]SEC93924.1 monosaccharide ABC transporter membrane protein, CUT2 family [Tenacibaculum sp. MAR_2009_124]